jgi:hypothetical protein
MEKTLAQLKRDLIVGVKLEIIEYKDGRYSTCPEKMQGIRYIKSMDTTGIYLQHIDESKIYNRRGSFLAYPKAIDCVYTDEAFAVVMPDNTKITYKIIK